MNILGKEILDKAHEYLSLDGQLKDQNPPLLVVNFVIEKFKEHRHYPDTFSAEQIENDLRNHISTLAMCVVDIFSHYGAEGETTHSEKNITRTYENAYMSQSLLNGVLPYVQSL